MKLKGFAPILMAVILGVVAVTALFLILNHSKPQRQQKAVVKEINGKSHVVFNGISGNEFDSIFLVTVSPDGKRVAYRGEISTGRMEEAKEYLVIDEKTYGPYWPNQAPGSIPTDPPVFSPNSEHFAFQAQAFPPQHDLEIPGQFIVWDGTEQKRYRSVGQPVFSSDSSNLAYVATVCTRKYEAVMGQSPEGCDIETFVVLNSTEQKHYSDVWDYIFSPDGKHLAYRAVGKDKSYLVLNGKEVREYPIPKEIHGGVGVRFSQNSELLY